MESNCISKKISYELKNVEKNASSFSNENQSQPKNEKTEEIKKLLKEMISNPLAQAILKIFLSSNIVLKSFLLIFVIVSTSAASFLVIRSIMEYFSYGVSSMSRTIYETPTLFPKITICNPNPLTTEYAFNKSKQMGISDFYLVDEYFLNEEKKELGHDFKDILLDCTFNKIKCNSSDFSWSFDDNYGNCYTFNSDLKRDLKRSIIAGPNYGLRLTLYVNAYEKLLDKIKGKYYIFL